MYSFAMVELQNSLIYLGDYRGDYLVDYLVILLFQVNQQHKYHTTNVLLYGNQNRKQWIYIAYYIIIDRYFKSAYWYSEGICATVASVDVELRIDHEGVRVYGQRAELRFAQGC